MTQLFLDKTALVTGGGRGIGRAITHKLAAGGAAFIGVHYARDQAAAEATVAALRAQGVSAAALGADFSVDAQAGVDSLWHAFSRAVKQHTGAVQLDILVNNAGLLYNAALAHSEVAMVKETLSVNVEAPFFLMKAAAPHLNEGGRIINVSSALTRIADPMRPIYSASKGAINALTLSLAAEFGHKNVTVNAVSPGITDTDMNLDTLNTPEKRAQAARYSVFSRLGTGGDVANLVAYLASQEASWVTGQVIDVSGGTYL